MDFSRQIEDNRRALIADVLRRLEEQLGPFHYALDAFLAQLFKAVIPHDWREKFHAFIAEQEGEGFTIAESSVSELEAWIEAWGKDCKLWPEATAEHAIEDEHDDESESTFVISVTPDISGPKISNTSAKTAVQVSVPKIHLPADYRGTWKGTKGNGTFTFNRSKINVKAGVAGKSFRFQGNNIAVGGFPAEAYYGGSANSASVTIGTVTGTSADAKAAQAEMRRQLGKPSWKTPKNYRWHHAGPPGSRTMELVKVRFHRALAHRGPGADLRSQTRNANPNGKRKRSQNRRRQGGGKGRGKGINKGGGSRGPKRRVNGGAKPVTSGGRTAGAKAVTSRAVLIFSVYMNIRDVLQTAGVFQPDYYEDVRQTYYYKAADESIFVVWPARFYRSGYLEFISGPRKGETVWLTESEVDMYRAAAEKKWGKYIPGSLFTSPRFIPGTDLKQLPVYQTSPGGVTRRIGWIDEEGFHESIDPRPEYI